MAPPSLNPQPMGTGQPQQSLPNMGSPFAQQNPAQQTNPFMGGGNANNANNASNSPFTGNGAAGFKNPFSTEHGGSGNPFGGGTAGGGVKGLIESNNKLIQAINKLTAIFEKVSQKMGQGGIGGAIGGGGMAGALGGAHGGLGGMDPLQAAQMRALAAGGLGGGGRAPNRNVNPFQVQGDYAGSFTYQNIPMTNDPGVQRTFTSAIDENFREHVASQQAQQQAQQRQQDRARGFLGTGFGARHETLNPVYLDPNNPTTTEYQGALQGHYNRNDAVTNQARSDFGNYLYNNSIGRILGPANAPGYQKLGNAIGYGASTYGAGINTAMGMGTSQDLVQMMSQIPYVGGLTAAPYSALQNRINRFASSESLARLVAQQGGTAQTGNYFDTHLKLFANLGQTLGLTHEQALNEELQMQEASGILSGANYGNTFGGRTLTKFLGAGISSQTVGSFMKLNRTDKMLKFNPDNIFKYGLSLGLGDQGQMELLGAFEGIQNMVPGMGYRGNASRILGQVANNTNNGFIGTQGVLQAQRQIQGTAEAGRGLKGTFGGLLETMTMADMLIKSGGDISKAIRTFEGGYATDPSALKGALTSRFGKKVTEMGYLASMTSADYDNIGQGQFAQAELPGIQNADIVLSKKQNLVSYGQGQDLYSSRKVLAERLIDINQSIEQQLVSGIKLRDMDKISNSLIEISGKIQALNQRLVPLVDGILNLLKRVIPGL